LNLILNEIREQPRWENGADNEQAIQQFRNIENQLDSILHQKDEEDEESEESGSDSSNSHHNDLNNNNNSRAFDIPIDPHRNEENDNDDDGEVEEFLQQRRNRSHLSETINHPLSEPVDVPPPSLTQLVMPASGNAPPYMNVVVSESNVASLMDMGFQRNLAEFALKTCDDDVDAALDRLLNRPEELQLDILKSLFFFS